MILRRSGRASWGRRPGRGAARRSSVAGWRRWPRCRVVEDDERGDGVGAGAGRPPVAERVRERRPVGRIHLDPGRPRLTARRREDPDAARRCRHEAVEEPRAAAPAFAGRTGPTRRPGQPQVAPSPGDPDVEQATLLGQLVGFGRLADRERALLECREEDRVPFEALRPVVGQKLDAGRDATGLDGGASLDLGEEGPVPASGSVRITSSASSSRVTTAAWRAAAASPSGIVSRRTPSSRSKAAASRAGTGPAGHVSASAARSSPDATRTARRTSGRAEEALAADVERDPRPAERVLERRELGVGPHEDGHRTVRRPVPREQP